MATLRNKKIAAVSRETLENTSNGQSQNTHDPGMAQGYISRVSEETEWRVTRKFSKEFSRTESRILGALYKIDEFLPNPQVRTCSVAVLETSRNNDPENREPTGDRSPGYPCPKAVFSVCHSSNLNDSEQEETHHSCPKTNLLLTNCSDSNAQPMKLLIPKKLFKAWKKFPKKCFLSKIRNEKCSFSKAIELNNFTDALGKESTKKELQLPR